VIMKTKNKIILSSRIDLYFDFTVNLIGNIIFYYIDEESLSEDEDINNHFNWCFNRVCKEFEDEEIYFRDNDDLREYFIGYFYSQFYTTKKRDERFYKKFWQDIFDHKNINKRKRSTYVLLEVYKIFDKSLPIKKY